MVLGIPEGIVSFTCWDLSCPDFNTFEFVRGLRDAAATGFILLANYFVGESWRLTLFESTADPRACSRPCHYRARVMCTSRGLHDPQ